MTPERAVSEGLTWVREALHARCGLRSEEVTDLALERALRAAAGAAGATLDELIARIREPSSDGGLALQHLLRKVTVGETTFFRHVEDLDWLRTRVFPDIVARRERDGSRRLRIWSAGCATGEEAYTLAFLAMEAVPSSDWTIQINASDINDESLAAARKATYGEWSFRGVPPELRTRWFEPAGHDGREVRWRPLPGARKLVDFQYLNLRDPIFPSIFTRTTELDLIVCRNVFIYFFPEAIRTTLERFASCVVEDGYVLCGPADLFQLRGQLESMHEDGAPHRLRVSAADAAKAAKAALPAPTLNGTRPLGPSPRRRATLKPRVAPLAARAPSMPPAVAPVDVVRLLSSGDYATAALRAKELLAKDPLAIEVARCRALALSALGEPSAADAWATVLYLDAADPGAHFGMAMVLLHAGRRAEARAHFRAVTRLLRDVHDDAALPGPDAIPAGWVKAACRSLTGEGGAK